MVKLAYMDEYKTLNSQINPNYIASAVSIKLLKSNYTSVFKQARQLKTQNLGKFVHRCKCTVYETKRHSFANKQNFSTRMPEKTVTRLSGQIDE